MNIAEAAELSNVTPSALRYYEKIGLIPPVKRKAGGVREYDEENLNWIEFIKCMKSSGLSIESLVKYTELFQIGDQTLEERKEILLNEYQKLLQKQQEINSTVEKLKLKIKNYDQKMVIQKQNRIKINMQMN